MFRNSKSLGKQFNILFTNEKLCRSKHSSQGLKLKSFGVTSTKTNFHQPKIQEYPVTEQLPLPPNIKDLVSTEKFNFSPKRTREINGSFISSSSNSHQTVNLNLLDGRVECYDCFGAVNLSSSMQTNVPYPFVSNGKPTHLNMPGGQWGQRQKYMSGDLNKLHHINTKPVSIKNGGNYLFGIKRGSKSVCFYVLDEKTLFCSLNFWPNYKTQQFNNFSTHKSQNSTGNSDVEEKKLQSPVLTRKQKLQKLVKEYGSVILVFHVGISLISLGCCYLIVSSGVDVSKVMKYWGVDEGSAAAGTAAYFVVAYAVHKAMAPIRMGITITAAPFIVKKLRKFKLFKSS